MALDTIATPGLWIGFTAVVFIMLAIDLGVFHKSAHEVHYREALTWTFVWIALSLVFNYVIYHMFGRVKALEFLTGYVVEKALSVDNLFVFLVIFSYFAVPKTLQHRVLFWGVLGALIMRAFFIFVGAALLQRFHWIMYVFGVILVITGVKLLRQTEEDLHPEKNPVYRFFARMIPSVPAYDGQRFFTIRDGRRLATPLLLVLIAVEISDLVFAVDSIPAIFGVTTDPFIVYTSNVFAILGLRALYFVLANVMDQFHYLNVGLAAVLVFIGIKMLIVDFYKIPIGAALGVVLGLLIIAIVASLVWPKPAEEADTPPAE